MTYGRERSYDTVVLFSKDRPIDHFDSIEAYFSHHWRIDRSLYSRLFTVDTSGNIHVDSVYKTRKQAWMDYWDSIYPDHIRRRQGTEL